MTKERRIGGRTERDSRVGMIPSARNGRGKQVHNLRYSRLPTGATGRRARTTRDRSIKANDGRSRRMTQGTKGTKGTNTVGRARSKDEGAVLEGRDFKLEISNLKDEQKWEFKPQRFNRGLRG